MKRNETRYKGVWSAGYNEAMNEATRTLWRFVKEGGQFSFDHDDAWNRGTLAIKLGDRVSVPTRQVLIIGMEILLDKDAA